MTLKAIINSTALSLVGLLIIASVGRIAINTPDLLNSGIKIYIDTSVVFEAMAGWIIYCFTRNSNK